jgi:hypothetical protein
MLQMEENHDFETRKNKEKYKKKQYFYLTDSYLYCYPDYHQFDCMFFCLPTETRGNLIPDGHDLCPTGTEVSEFNKQFLEDLYASL